MLIAIEGQVLSDELIDDEILVGQIGSWGWCIVEGAKNLSSYFGSDLWEYSSFFEGLFEYFFKFVDGCHII